MTKLTISYSDDYLNWKLGNGDGRHPTNAERARLATNILVEELGDGVTVIEPTIMPNDRAELESIHSPAYVAEVIDEGRADDWVGKSTTNGRTAFQMFAGTARLTEAIIAGDIKVGFNPQGAKHHAQYAWSEGFCVFNDFAWASKKFADAGLRPLYIDWDVNAGDGVQNLLASTDIPTLSIHGSGIYPIHNDTYSKDKFGETHTHHNLDEHWYNWNLAQGSGDAEFADALYEVEEVVARYKPDVILVAIGADGHELDNWGLKYSYEGFHHAGSVVRGLAEKYCEGRVLIGGAGGYRPYDATPLSWANSVAGVLGEPLIRR
jgi:acetoin utilization protein AcuC